jgi:hypothetical protein
MSNQLRNQTSLNDDETMTSKNSNNNNQQQQASKLVKQKNVTTPTTQSENSIANVKTATSTATTTTTAKSSLNKTSSESTAGPNKVSSPTGSVTMPFNNNNNNNKGGQSTLSNRSNSGSSSLNRLNMIGGTSPSKSLQPQSRKEEFEIYYQKCLRGLSHSINIIKATTMRLVFSLHSFIAIIYVYLVRQNEWYFLNFIGVVFVLIELFVTIIKRKGKEPRW